MQRMVTKKTESGFGMAEAVVAVGILASFVIVVAGVNTLYLNIALGDKQPLGASVLLEEGVEATRFMRDESWDDRILPATIGGTYYLDYSSGWSLTDTPVVSGIFTRTLVMNEVYRNSDGEIVASGGTLDPDTRLATVSVSWPSKSGVSTRTAKIYLTNLFDN